MEGLTLSAKEQNRLQVLNGVLEQRWSMREAAPLLGVSERQGWRLLAAYRKEGARGLAHKNRGRIPPNATPKNIQQQVVALAAGVGRVTLVRLENGEQNPRFKTLTALARALGTDVPELLGEPESLLQ